MKRRISEILSKRTVLYKDARNILISLGYRLVGGKGTHHRWKNDKMAGHIRFNYADHEIKPHAARTLLQTLKSFGFVKEDE